MIEGQETELSFPEKDKTGKSFCYPQCNWEF